MRFCLKCRSFSGGGPLCTQCGRSFGGRLCKGRTKHLNPYDARFCNHCGTSDLLEGATSIPLGWISRLAIVAFLFFGGRWLLLEVTHAPNLSFKALTGYHDIGVWFFETFGRFILFLLFLAFVSSFFPGDAGRWFRSTMFDVVGRVISLFFKVLERVIFVGGHLLLRSFGVEIEKKKK